MKNHIHPCADCYPKECYEFCIKCKKYYSALIKSYAKYGNSSKLWKYSRSYMPFNKRMKIKNTLDRFFNVAITNTNSGKTIVFNRKGGMVKYNPKDEVGGDLRSAFRQFFGNPLDL